MAITGQLTLNEILIVEVDSDPSAGGGATAPIGSFALLDDKVNGRMWIKSGALDTGWSLVPRLANGTAFTSGSVLYADANGFISQNNASFFWDLNNARLGLGINSPQARVHVDAGTGIASALKFTVGATTGQSAGDGFEVGVDTAGNGELRQRENSFITALTSNINALTITPTQRVIVGNGTTSLPSAASEEYRLQIQGLTSVDSGVSQMRYSNDAIGPIFRFVKSRGATLGAQSTVLVNDLLGTMSFRGSDGTNAALSATISGYVDAATATNSIPGSLRFSTTTLAGTTVQERMRIDSSGRVMIGGAAAQDITGAGAFPLFQILGTGAVQMVQIQYSNDTIAPVFNSLKSRGATIGSQGILAAEDELGRFQFRGSDGTNFVAGASIRALVDGTPATASMPGRIIMMTTATGQSAPTERLRIDSLGQSIFSQNIRVGNSVSDIAGNIRYTGSDFEGYHNGVWYSITGGLRRKYIYFTTAIQTTTSNVYANVTELVSVSLPIGRYTVRCTGLWQSANAGNGIGVRLGQGTAVIGTIAVNWFIAQAGDGTAKYFGYDQTLVAKNVTATTVAATNTNAVFTCQGAFQVTTAGTVAIQIRSEANGSTASIRPGSILTIEEVV